MSDQPVKHMRPWGVISLLTVAAVLAWQSGSQTTQAIIGDPKITGTGFSSAFGYGYCCLSAGNSCNITYTSPCDNPNYPEFYLDPAACNAACQYGGQMSSFWNPPTDCGGTFPSCDGTCDAGSVCVSNILDGTCSCQSTYVSSPSNTCGNNVCETGEAWNDGGACTEDCQNCGNTAPACNGTCPDGQVCSILVQGGSSSAPPTCLCVSDPCGDGICAAGEDVSCPGDCANASSSSIPFQECDPEDAPANIASMCESVRGSLAACSFWGCASSGFCEVRFVSDATVCETNYPLNQCDMPAMCFGGTCVDDQYKTGESCDDGDTCTDAYCTDIGSCEVTFMDPTCTPCANEGEACGVASCCGSFSCNNGICEAFVQSSSEGIGSFSSDAAAVSSESGTTSSEGGAESSETATQHPCCIRNALNQYQYDSCDVTQSADCQGEGMTWRSDLTADDPGLSDCSACGTNPTSSSSAPSQQCSDFPTCTEVAGSVCDDNVASNSQTFFATLIEWFLPSELAAVVREKVFVPEIGRQCCCETTTVSCVAQGGDCTASSECCAAAPNCVSSTFDTPGHGTCKTEACIATVNASCASTDCCAPYVCGTGQRCVVPPASSSAPACAKKNKGEECATSGDCCPEAPYCLQDPFETTKYTCDTIPCSNAGQSCASQSCCGGFTCDATAKTCIANASSAASVPASSAPACKQVTESCSAAAGQQCCTALTCVDGTCRQCQAIGQACSETQVCCSGDTYENSGSCIAGTCAACKNEDDDCTADSDCCSGYSCSADKKCVPKKAPCCEVFDNRVVNSCSETTKAQCQGLSWLTTWEWQEGTVPAPLPNGTIDCSFCLSGDGSSSSSPPMGACCTQDTYNDVYTCYESTVDSCTTTVSGTTSFLPPPATCADCAPQKGACCVKGKPLCQQTELVTQAACLAAKDDDGNSMNTWVGDVANSQCFDQYCEPQAEDIPCCVYDRSKYFSNDRSDSVIGCETVKTESACVTKGASDPAIMGIYRSDLPKDQCTKDACDLGKADVAVSKTLTAPTGDQPLSAGDTVTFGITVTNNGPDAAQNIQVIDSFGNTLEFVSLSGCIDTAVDPGAYTQTSCHIGSLPKGGTTSLTATFKVKELDSSVGCDLGNRAQVSADSTDEISHNNLASAEGPAGYCKQRCCTMFSMGPYCSGQSKDSCKDEGEYWVAEPTECTTSGDSPTCEPTGLCCRSGNGGTNEVVKKSQCTGVGISFHQNVGLDSEAAYCSYKRCCTTAADNTKSCAATKASDCTDANEIWMSDPATCASTCVADKGLCCVAKSPGTATDKYDCSYDTKAACEGKKGSWNSQMLECSATKDSCENSICCIPPAEKTSGKMTCSANPTECTGNAQIVPGFAQCSDTVCDAYGTCCETNTFVKKADCKKSDGTPGTWHEGKTPAQNACQKKQCCVSSEDLTEETQLTCTNAPKVDCTGDKKTWHESESDCETHCKVQPGSCCMKLKREEDSKVCNADVKTAFDCEKLVGKMHEGVEVLAVYFDTDPNRLECNIPAKNNCLAELNLVQCCHSDGTCKEVYKKDCPKGMPWGLECPLQCKKVACCQGDKCLQEGLMHTFECKAKEGIATETEKTMCTADVCKSDGWVPCCDKPQCELKKSAECTKKANGEICGHPDPCIALQEKGICCKKDAKACFKQGLVTKADCEPGGVWKTGDKDCADALCPDVAEKGICCKKDAKACFKPGLVTKGECEPDGVWKAGAADCADALCPDVAEKGICCTADGGYLADGANPAQVTSEECKGEGQVWKAGTDPKVCLGACCGGGDGKACEAGQTKQSCETVGTPLNPTKPGVWKGPANSCTPDPCTGEADPEVACCSGANNACEMKKKSECADDKEKGTSCMPNPCTPPAETIVCCENKACVMKNKGDACEKVMTGATECTDAVKEACVNPPKYVICCTKGGANTYTCDETLEGNCQIGPNVKAIAAPAEWGDEPDSVCENNVNAANAQKINLACGAAFAGCAPGCKPAINGQCLLGQSPSITLNANLLDSWLFDEATECCCPPQANSSASAGTTGTDGGDGGDGGSDGGDASSSAAAVSSLSNQIYACQSGTCTAVASCPTNPAPTFGCFTGDPLCNGKCQPASSTSSKAPSSSSKGQESSSKSAESSSTSPESSSSASSVAPKLTLTKSVGAATVVQGGYLNFAIGVKNTGTADAAGFTFSDTLPASMQLFAFSDDSATVTCVKQGDNGLSCTGMLPKEQGVTVLLTAAVGTQCGAFTNTASAQATGAASVTGSANFTVTCPISSSSSKASEPASSSSSKPASSSSSVSSSISAHSSSQSSLTVDLEVKKSGPTSLNAGEAATYTITITNTGMAPYASDVQFTESWTFPRGLLKSITSSALMNCTGTPANLKMEQWKSAVCTIKYTQAAPLAPGASVNVTVTLAVPVAKENPNFEPDLVTLEDSALTAQLLAAKTLPAIETAEQYYKRVGEKIPADEEADMGYCCLPGYMGVPGCELDGWKRGICLKDYASWNMQKSKVGPLRGAVWFRNNNACMQGCAAVYSELAESDGKGGGGGAGSGGGGGGSPGGVSGQQTSNSSRSSFISSPSSRSSISSQRVAAMWDTMAASLLVAESAVPMSQTTDVCGESFRNSVTVNVSDENASNNSAEVTGSIITCGGGGGGSSAPSSLSSSSEQIVVITAKPSAPRILGIKETQFDPKIINAPIPQGPIGNLVDAKKGKASVFTAPSVPDRIFAPLPPKP